VTALQLQEMTSDQLPAVLELDQLCFGGLWTAEGYQRELDSPNSDLLVLNSPELIGMGCYWAILDEAHITIVGIHPNDRKKGLGQLMLLTLLHRAQQREMARATLEVRISNESAINLYQKLGFKIAGQRKGYYADTGEDALILWLGELQTAAFTERFSKFWQESCDRLKQQQIELVIQPNLLSIKNSALTCP
jgi:[ribosomal protein S18]-alanine N-acetyltransferase